MKALLGFVCFYLVSGQETSGSIVSLFGPPPPTDSEIEAMKRNAEDQQLLDAAPRPAPIDTARSEAAAASGLFQELSEISYLNAMLSSQNSALKGNFYDLEVQIKNAVEKVNLYRYYGNLNYKDLAGEIDGMESANQQMAFDNIQLKPKKTTADDGGSSEDGDDNDDDKEVSITGIVAIGICVCFLIVLGIRTSFGHYIDKDLTQVLYTLYENISIILLVSTFTIIINYTKPFNSIDYEYFLPGLVIFSIIWISFAFILILISQGYIIKWIRLEKSLVSLPKHLTSSQWKPFASFYILKKFFTDSPYILNPFNLRYFDFSEYLSKCLSLTLKDFFQVNWIGYCMIVITAVAWRILIYYDLDYEKYVMVGYPAGVAVIYFVVLLKLWFVHSQLVPEATAEVIERLDMNDVESLPMPKYLKGSIPIKAEGRMFFCLKIHPGKASFGYFFQGYIPSRHDLLFWFDIYGPRTLLGFFQGASISLCLWLTVEILYYFPKLGSYKEVLLISASISLWAISLLMILPASLKYLAITSNIEMRKNSKVIQSVLISQKILRSDLVLRIYRQLKMIFRDKFLKVKYQEISQVVDKIVDEIFEIHSDGDLGIEYLEDLLGMCGLQLGEDELRLFAKECLPDAENRISKDGFKKAVAVMLKSKAFSPRVVVRKLFVSYFRENLGKTLDEVTIEDLREFFTQFGWHFNDDDIEDFLVEAYEVGVNNIPGMVQDSLECSYK